jgi:ATP-dependent DNA helicase DinG
MKASDLLGAGGPLAAGLTGYELRPGQLVMADAVERALDEDRVLLCESGTGTGKTLAYLIPALLSGMKVVISTASRALQEQIVASDLPLCERHLGMPVDAVVVKGLRNYLCLRRLSELEGDTPRRGLPMVRAWARETVNGDIAELGSLPEHHPIWSAVASSSETRIGARCAFFERCFVTRLKRASAAAQLLVVNHHLLLADLTIRGDHPGSVLPPYDAVIIDEAHRLEDTASDIFGMRLSSRRVARLLSDGERTLAFAAIPAAGRALVESARGLSQALFTGLHLALPQCEGRQPLPADTWRGGLLEAYHELDDVLDALEATTREDVAAPALEQLAARVAELRAQLALLVEGPARAVTWFERDGGEVALATSPIDVGRLLREKLFVTGRPVVLTSASLTVGQSFAFARERLGLDEALEAPIDELVVPSPLDHQRQALLYTPTDLPEVTEDGFTACAAERIGELCALVPGGAFVLCTSLRSMHALAGELERHAAGRLLMVQGQAPKRALLDDFRARHGSLLVATMSFWEGVDVPGSALELVVIDRLPFAVPTDPVVEARCRAIEARGRPAFAGYLVPHAATLLKQGFGRLLRNRRDRGVVAILDKRIRTRGYGRVLVDSLPPTGVTTSLDEVARFWAGVSGAAPPLEAGQATPAR